MKKQVETGSNLNFDWKNKSTFMVIYDISKKVSQELEQSGVRC